MSYLGALKLTPRVSSTRRWSYFSFCCCFYSAERLSWVPAFFWYASSAAFCASVIMFVRAVMSPRSVIIWNGAKLNSHTMLGSQVFEVDMVRAVFVQVVLFFLSYDSPVYDLAEYRVSDLVLPIRVASHIRVALAVVSVRVGVVE